MISAGRVEASFTCRASVQRSALNHLYPAVDHLTQQEWQHSPPFTVGPPTLRTTWESREFS